MIIQETNLERIENCKSELLWYFNHHLSLNSNERIRFEDQEYSLQFIIGDSLKRNCKIFQQYSNYAKQYYEKHQNKSSDFERNSEEIRFKTSYGKKKISKKIDAVLRHYRNPVYVWEFWSIFLLILFFYFIFHKK